MMVKLKMWRIEDEIFFFFPLHVVQIRCLDHMTDRGLTDSSSSLPLADQRLNLLSHDQLRNQEFDCFHLKYQQC